MVLGAYGEAGSAVARGLAATKLFNVTAAGRDQKKLDLLVGSNADVSGLRLDIRDRSALDDALLGANLVINCVGPYVGMGADVANAAIAARVPYFDIASEQEHYRRLLSQDSACRDSGGLVLTGVGAYPGLSGIMLKALLKKIPNAQSGEMALITGHHADPSVGHAQEISGVVELAYDLMDLNDGKLRRITPGVRRDFEFPLPFGAAKVMNWPQMEVLSLAATGTFRDFSTFVALGGEKLPSRLELRLLRALRPTPESRVLAMCARVLEKRRSRALAKPPPKDAATNHGAIVITIRDGGNAHTASAVVNDLPGATAWLPIYAAKEWAAGKLDKSGVAIPMDVFDPEHVLAELKQDAERAAFVVNGL